MENFGNVLQVSFQMHVHRERIRVISIMCVIACDL